MTSSVKTGYKLAKHFHGAQSTVVQDQWFPATVDFVIHREAIDGGFGDADSVVPKHSVKLFELLGGGQKEGGSHGSGISSARLAILAGLTDYNISSSSALAPMVMPFLDAPLPTSPNGKEPTPRIDTTLDLGVCWP